MAGRDRCSSRLGDRSLTTRGRTPAVCYRVLGPLTIHDQAGYEVELAQVIVHPGAWTGVVN